MRDTRFWLWVTDPDADFWHYMAVFWLVILPVILVVVGLLAWAGVDIGGGGSDGSSTGF